jgi:hypothetical protein
MSILLSLLLAQARVLPEIDRRALDLQARAEALQTRRPASRPATTPQAAPQRRRGFAVTAQPRFEHPAGQPVRRAAQPQHLPSPRRASGGAMDLSAITTICRAAGTQGDPAGFLATLSRAYSLSASESSSLRTSCAAYLAGRADARVNNLGAPAH